MNILSEGDVVGLVIHWIHENQPTGSSVNVPLSVDTDLMASGLLDSFGFVELLLFLESQTGQKIDLTDVDPQDFFLVGRLSRIALKGKSSKIVA